MTSGEIVPKSELERLQEQADEFTAEDLRSYALFACDKFNGNIDFVKLLAVMPDAIKLRMAKDAYSNPWPGATRDDLEASYTHSLLTRSRFAEYDQTQSGYRVTEHGENIVRLMVGVNFESVGNRYPYLGEIQYNIGEQPAA